MVIEIAGPFTMFVLFHPVSSPARFATNSKDDDNGTQN